MKKYRQKKKVTYKDINEIVESRGGTLITKEDEFEALKIEKKTIPSKTKIMVRCKAGHEWWAIYDNLKNKKTWCKACMGLLPKTYDDIKKFVESCGGMLLTEKDGFESRRKKEGTIPTKTNINVWCKNKKHKSWETTQDRLHKSWCPYCKEGKYEAICRWYFEQIFSFVCGWEVHFPKTPLHKFVIPIDIPKDVFFKKMHFDGYTELNINNRRIKLAFEYNGQQHSKFPNHIHPDTEEGLRQFKKQQQHDEYKRWLCKRKENNIILIDFPYDVDRNMYNSLKIQHYIVNELLKLPQFEHIYPKLLKLPQFDHLYSNLHQTQVKDKKKVKKKIEGWKKALIVSNHLSMLYRGRFTSLQLGTALHIRRDSAGDHLKDLYEKGLVDREQKIKRKGTIRYYSYWMTNKGREELKYLPTYETIRKYFI